MGAEVKFKAGDRVRCNLRGSNGGIWQQVGDEFTVHSCSGGWVYFFGIGERFSVDRFELVTDQREAEPNGVDYGTRRECPPSIVNRPPHYTRYAIEPIEFIMKNKLEFWRGCVVKYTARAGHKLYDGMDAVQSEIVDHKKSIRYLEMRVKELEGNTEFAK